jgi:hypothetical protein
MKVIKEITKLPESPDANLKDLNPYKQLFKSSSTIEELPIVSAAISPAKQYIVN